MKLKKALPILCSGLLLASLLPVVAKKTSVYVEDYGELRAKLGDTWLDVDSLNVTGPIDATDFRTMYECSLNGRLTYLNLKYAAAQDGLIPDNAFWDSSLQSTSDFTARAIRLETLILPDNTRKIGVNSFKILQLKNFQLPLSVREFSTLSFHNANLGTDVLVIPEGVETIADYAFSGVRGVTALNLPSTLREIEPEAFASSSLADINFKEGLESIGMTAFHDCYSIRKITIPESCVSLAYGAFAGLINVRDMVFGNGITELPLHCAYGCLKLEYVDLPDNLEQIGVEAFYGCETLTSIDFPSPLRKIGEGAFSHTSLDSIVLPVNVEILESDAFATERTPNHIRCYSAVAPACLTPDGDFTDNIFGSHINYSIPVYIPYGSREAYENAFGWRRFSNFVEFNASTPGNVAGITDDTRPRDGILYDLFGRRIREAAPGQIYILNGRKYVGK